MLALLGAYHGINPGMGWLFAVVLGIQEKRRGAVIGALLPIVLGHAVSIAVVVTLVGLAQVVVPQRALSILCAVFLFAFGTYKLFRSRHPNWVGMRVNFKDLTVWSFLMASAHGAGLMLTPILLKLPVMEQTSSPHIICYISRSNGKFSGDVVGSRGNLPIARTIEQAYCADLSHHSVIYSHSFNLSPVAWREG